jgi:hypothetical protein
MFVMPLCAGEGYRQTINVSPAAAAWQFTAPRMALIWSRSINQDHCDNLIKSLDVSGVPLNHEHLDIYRVKLIQFPCQTDHLIVLNVNSP